MLRVGLLLVLATSLLAQSVDDDVSRHLERAVPEDFWGAVLVARDGRVLLARGYGRADKSGQPVTIDSLFDIGSVSKPFTAAAILKLEEQGRLTTPDSIAKHFTDVPADKEAITIHHLLTHTSGIPHDIKFGAAEYDDRDGMVARALKADLLSKPGARFQYSNVGYFLLAALVERASGQTFEAYLKKHIFGPAGMRDTGFVQDRDLDRRRQTVRAWKGTHGTVFDYPWNWANRGATGVVTTVRDLWTWDQALHSGKVLSPASLRRLATPDKAGYGYGWTVGHTLVGTPKHFHGGTTRGYAAHLARFPKERAIIAILTNNEGDPQALASRLEAVLFAPTDRLPPIAKDLAGRYRLPGNGSVFEVMVVDGRLRVTASGTQAACRVHYGVRELPSWPGLFERIGSKARRHFRAFASGNQEALFADDDAARCAAERWATALKRNGNYERFALLGSHSGQEVVSYFKVTFLGEAQVWRACWEGQQFRELAPYTQDHPFRIALDARSATEFAGRCVVGKEVVRIRFERGALIWHDGTIGEEGITCARRPDRVAAAGEERSTTELRKMLTSPDPATRVSAAHVLGEMGVDAQDCVAALADALAHPDLATRKAAVEALYEIKGVPASLAPKLIGAFKSEGGTQGDASKLRSLLLDMGSDCIPFLLAGLSDAKWWVRRSCASVLGRIGGRAEEVAPALILLLEDEQFDVRIGAAHAVLNLGDAAKPAVPKIRKVIAEVRNRLKRSGDRIANQLEAKLDALQSEPR